MTVQERYTIFYLNSDFQIKSFEVENLDYVQFKESHIILLIFDNILNKKLTKEEYVILLKGYERIYYNNLKNLSVFRNIAFNEAQKRNLKGINYDVLSLIESISFNYENRVVISGQKALYLSVYCSDADGNILDTGIEYKDLGKGNIFYDTSIFNLMNVNELRIAWKKANIQGERHEVRDHCQSEILKLSIAGTDFANAITSDADLLQYGKIVYHPQYKPVVSSVNNNENEVSVKVLSNSSIDYG
jgi:hypothetical protein